MNGIEFGKELKKIRGQVGYPSKPLSEKIGKAITYVSQLERGLIKNPDFDSCVKLLKELSFPINKIEDFLYSFGIVSEQRKEQELKQNKINSESNERAKEEANDDYIKYYYPWLYDDEKAITKLKKKNENLLTIFNSMVENDYSRAEKVITNIVKLSHSKDSFDFFCSLFEYDFFSITAYEKEKLIQLIQEMNLDDSKTFDWEGEE
ncbi:helix-turn-helix domain-containing protein [Psychrobacillus sp. FSL K6-1415]|uniref:helix-turn-helix domain-containing protein n=1 Tax=Psychrobacillus sp. FSL K6-1415 TaxID=2921544 RepID=UPI0030FB5DD0